MTLHRHLRAAICLAGITLNLVFWVILLLLLLPAKAPRRTRSSFRRLANRIYRRAVRVDNALLRHVSGATWRCEELTLDPARPHIVLANHRSWADILIVQSVVATSGPIVKFLCKRELLYVPIFGLIILAFDFPVLRRRSRRGSDPAHRREDDRRRVTAASAALLDSPAAILSFAEGTRFTEAKREALGGPYEDLLPPRAGGLAAMIEALAPGEGTIVDLTLAYSRAVSFWEFLGGAAGPVNVRWETIPIADVPPERAQEWLNDRWRRKDELLRSTIFMDLDSDLANLSEME
ncbi:MAG: acetyltransferase [Acidobacteria bacterium]|nr:acetyltransferase [Acidobacteriota bacterium]